MIHHDLTDAEWRIVQAMLLEKEPGARRRGQRGRTRAMNRNIINGILWRLRTNELWKKTPEKYGKWTAIYRCFRRWEMSGAWQKLAMAFAETLPDMTREAIMRHRPGQRLKLPVTKTGATKTSGQDNDGGALSMAAGKRRGR